MLSELDPITGAMLSEVQTSIPAASDVDLAIDGNRLLVTDRTTNQIHHLAMDAALIDQTEISFFRTLTGSTTTSTWGAANVSGAVIFVSGTFSLTDTGSVSNTLMLAEFDPVSE